jgi:predicted dehydrogenase
VFDALGGRAWFVSDAFLGGPFAHGWRLERGALLDVGPHAVDLLDAALGPVVAVRAAGDRHGAVHLLLEHERGATSSVTLCCRVGIEPSRTEAEVFGPGGLLAVDVRAAIGPGTFAEVARAFAAAAADPAAPNPLDAGRGLHLQRVLAEADGQIG